MFQLLRMCQSTGYIKQKIDVADVDMFHDYDDLELGRCFNIRKCPGVLTNIKYHLGQYPYDMIGFEYKGDIFIISNAIESEPYSNCDKIVVTLWDKTFSELLYDMSTIVDGLKNEIRYLTRRVDALEWK